MAAESIAAFGPSLAAAIELISKYIEEVRAKAKLRDESTFGGRVKAINHICVFHEDTATWKVTHVPSNETKLFTNGRSECAFLLAKRHTIGQHDFDFMPLVVQPQAAFHPQQIVARRALLHNDEYASLGGLGVPPYRPYPFGGKVRMCSAMNTILGNSRNLSYRRPGIGLSKLKDWVGLSKDKSLQEIRPHSRRVIKDGHRPHP